MTQFFVGIDVSKGYADVAILNQSGTWLPFEGRVDDSRGGHDRLLARLRELRAPNDEFERVFRELLVCFGGY
jgi:hypothetical protein